jgi:hypothetical protein
MLSPDSATLRYEMALRSGLFFDIQRDFLVYQVPRTCYKLVPWYRQYLLADFRNEMPM